MAPSAEREPDAPAERTARPSRPQRMNRLRNLLRRRSPTWLYEDDVVRLDETGITILGYYWPFGRKLIPYDDIDEFSLRPLKAWHGQFRVHGIDLRGRWYSRDRHRGEKEMAIDLDLGTRIRPVLTPDDPDGVVEILRAQLDRSSHLEPTEDVHPPAEESPESWLL